MPGIPKKYNWLLTRLSLPFEDVCVEWPYGKNSEGYGYVSLGGKCLRVIRVACEVVHGPASSELVVMHSCDNPSCFNPRHLKWGTVGSNTVDAFVKGRRKGRSGTDNPQAKLDDASVRVLKELYSSGKSQTEIARDMKVSQSLVSLIVTGKRRKRTNGTHS